MTSASPTTHRPIARWLAAAPPSILVAYAIVCSFATYFAMKSFVAASYDRLSPDASSLGLKRVLVKASSRIEFLETFSCSLSIVGAAGLLLTAAHFHRVTRKGS